MTVDEDELRDLLAGATGVRAPAPPPGTPGSARPLASIQARAAELGRVRRVRRRVGAATCLLAAAAVGLLVRSGSGQGDPDTTVPARSVAPTSIGGEPMPVLSLAPQVACAIPPVPWFSATRIDYAGRIADVPARLLALPDAAIADPPRSVTAGRASCPLVPDVIGWSDPGAGGGASQLVLEVSGPDDTHPCSSPGRPAWTGGGAGTRATARGVTVTVLSGGTPFATCVRWTEPDGHRWFALSSSTDRAQVLHWLDQLHLTRYGVDPASAPDGLLQTGSRRPYQDGSTPSRAFLEVNGVTRQGRGYTLAVLEAGGSQTAPSGAGVEPVPVRGATGWWLPATRDLVWRDGDGPWYVLRTASSRQEAVRVAASLRSVRADDPRWSVYLSAANGYHGTPSPPLVTAGPSASPGPT